MNRIETTLHAGVWKALALKHFVQENFTGNLKPNRRFGLQVAQELARDYPEDYLKSVLWIKKRNAACSLTVEEFFDYES